jgi:hypothetical protein
MSKKIVFVVGSKIQWKNFICISPYLINKKYKIHFVLLDNYECKSFKIPKFNDGIIFSILETNPTNKFLYFLFNRKFFKRFLPLFSLNKAWHKFLNKINPNLVVFGVDHSIIHYYMINVCNLKSIKTAVLQDAYIVGRILLEKNFKAESYRSKKTTELTELKTLARAQNGKYWMNKLVLLSRRFNLNFLFPPKPFNSGTDFIGLIGEEAKRCIATKSTVSSKISIVGSPRYEDFVRKANEYTTKSKSNIENRNIKKDNIIFIQTNYDYVSGKLEHQQQQSIIWLCKSIQNLKVESKMKVNVFLHTATKNIKEYVNIQNKFKNIIILSEGGFEPSIIEKSLCCFTMGSTGLLDFYLAKIKCAIIVSPKTKKPLLGMGILEFGFPLIQSDDKLIKFITDESYMTKVTIENEILFDKIANFKSNWNSIEKTTNWITSIVESK